MLLAVVSCRSLPTTLTKELLSVTTKPKWPILFIEGTMAKRRWYDTVPRRGPQHQQPTRISFGYSKHFAYWTKHPDTEMQRLECEQI